MNKKGFTLIELVMVIVIIGILAAIAIPRFIDLRRDARQASCQATGGAIRAALSNFYASSALRSETPHFPTTMASIEEYMQSDVTVIPTAGGNWTDSTYYNSTSGALNVTAACPR